MRTQRTFLIIVLGTALFFGSVPAWSAMRNG